MSPLFGDDGGATYDDLVAEFSYTIPAQFNLGEACVVDHPPDSIAIIAIDRDGKVSNLTYAEFDDLTSRLARHLTDLGISQGDRVGVVAPQSRDVGLAHVAIWRAGAVSLPLASLFGPDALRFRLTDSEASMAIVSPENLDKVTEAVPGLPLMVMGSEFEAALEGPPMNHPTPSDPEDPVFLIYTSGTTGPPKGALHAHRTIFGHLPGFELFYDFAPQPGDVIWTPADWAWIGALMDVVVPAWYYGMTVLTDARDFDPQHAVRLMAEHHVTLAFLPPTALKMMRAADVDGAGLKLRAIFTGGEALGAEMLEWAEAVLECPINEGYGQTEANIVVGNSSRVWPVRPGSMGRSLPGHVVEVHDDAGRRLIDEVGEIVVHRDDPVVMLGYWNNPRATREKFSGDWLLTGDLGREDPAGYLWFESRKDDVISSMGYRIGPGEIEESLMRHQVPAAFVVLRGGSEPSEELALELQDHVRTRLAAHEVPRQITFLDDLPKTTTGKLLRRALREL